MLNKTIFVQNMAGLCEVYDKSLTKTLQNIYYAILRDMQDEDFKQAVKRLLQERVFATFPKPAEILSLTNIKKEAILEVNETELKAKELILWCETANSTIFDNAKKSGRTFEDELKGTKFISLSDSDMSVLNQVKPYMSHKELINNIRVYQTSKDTLSAFMDALKYEVPDSQMITNPIQNLRIKR